MARLILKGVVAEVELTRDAVDDRVYAECIEHPDDEACNWADHYDDMNDATEYATDYADEGKR